MLRFWTLCNEFVDSLQSGRGPGQPRETINHIDQAHCLVLNHEIELPVISAIDLLSTMVAVTINNFYTREPAVDPGFPQTGGAIRKFPNGVAPAYYLTKFHRKMHENEENCTKRRGLASKILLQVEHS